MKSALIPIILTTLLMACASKPQQPDWISGNSSKYPDSRYLIGRGQADSAATARDRARADLAKNFQVAISEQSEDTQSHSQLSVGGQQQQESSASSSRRIATTTDQIIEGVEIAELWQSPDSKQFHALAVLKRLQAGQRLRAMIQQLDEATRSYIRAARSSGDLIAQIGAASRALDSQDERQVYQKLLQIIDRSGVGVPASFSLASLQADRDALLARLRIKPEIATDSLGNIHNIVAGALAAAGFQHTTDDQANYLLMTNFLHSELHDPQGWYWIRGSLDIKLVDPVTHQVRGSKRWQIKVSAQDSATARQRAFDKLDQVLQAELGDAIVRFGITE